MMRIVTAVCAAGLLAGASRTDNVLVNGSFEGLPWGPWVNSWSGNVLVDFRLMGVGQVPDGERALMFQFPGFTGGTARLTQMFAPVPRARIREVSFWWGQATFGSTTRPEVGLIYTDQTSSVYSPTVAVTQWTRVDMTPLLDPTKQLAGVSVSWSSRLSFALFDAFVVDVTPVCYANCDDSTIVPVLTVADFACFLNRFAAGDSYANCDGSTAEPTLTVSDFACFLNRFAAGCS